MKKKKLLATIALASLAHAQSGLAETLKIDVYGESTTYGADLNRASDGCSILGQTMPDYLQAQVSSNPGGYATVGVANEGVSATTGQQLLSGTDTPSYLCGGVVNGYKPRQYAGQPLPLTSNNGPHNPVGPFSTPWMNQLASSSARIVILNRGINEAGQSVSSTTFQSTMMQLVDAARKLGKTVVLQTPNAVNTTYASRVTDNVTALKNLAKSMNILISDGNALSQGYCTGGYYVDYPACVHPNTTLYGMMVNGSGLANGDLGKNGVGSIGSNSSGTVSGVVGAVKVLNLTTAVTRLYVGMFTVADEEVL